MESFVLLATGALPAMQCSMDEKRYHVRADTMLMHCFDQCEAAFEAGALDDLELQGGILTIQVRPGYVYVVSKHAPSLQLWLASPISGGLHFFFDEVAQRWCLADGRELGVLLVGELRTHGIEVVI